ncbi:hypothetical protein C8R46DRAFT_1265913 [Mycena filopes]|nr:hypothetical protein C8R46DRAFT_1265913 [Mycena filopes]
MAPFTPPSPGFVPGAWPSSLHRRSTTCPTPRPVLDPLHLEHVLDFQSRLVSQMAEPETSPSLAASASADSAIAPADSLESDLTRFRTDTSTSIVTDTSVSTTFTSRSSPERLVTAKLPLFKTKYPPVENTYPTRIPRPTNAARSTSDQTRARNRPHRQNIFSDSPSPPRAQTASLLTVDYITVVIIQHAWSLWPFTGVSHDLCLT